MLSKWRWLVLVGGPAPILAASVALTAWVRSEDSPGPRPNDVVERVQPQAELSPPLNKRVSYLAPQAAEPDTLPSLCEQAAASWGRRLGAGCEVISRPPFVIAGDLAATELDNWHRHTIAPAAKALWHCYLEVRPNAPVSVLLFRSEESYNRYAKGLFGDEGISVYGYYKPNHRTLVMNIATGGGTLVHELTHALVDFDFPTVPAWFNEGLASLHEQCRFRDDGSGPWIEGLPNWRLPGLQQAIRAGRLRSLKSLIGDDDFRGRSEGMNYAQARYFCLYLQERGLLKEFYQTLRRGAAQDRLGLEAIGRVLPDFSWQKLDREFQEWAVGIKDKG